MDVAIKVRLVHFVLLGLDPRDIHSRRISKTTALLPHQPVDGILCRR